MDTFLTVQEFKMYLGYLTTVILSIQGFSTDALSVSKSPAQWS